eukprot:CAMPEP_0194211742 /NCGR_PEP_ID=MMETSP0156-20130528/11075_1 /TAXON_ID=33649 /ORGANISM="Thalassionema nitzschioides, Strain L26-B" /LENGTH=222 /DNA_ID=CAMNT_0038939389 /DNA_START=198 /DNA_END=866 /DNA_ORIENTATION=+
MAQSQLSQRSNRTPINDKSKSLLHLNLNFFPIGSEKKEEEKEEKRKTEKTLPVVHIESEDEYHKFLEEDNRLCVIKFYASWCKSCQKFGVKFRHLATQEGDVFNSDNQLVQSGRVRFAEIEFGANTKLCRSLKIKRLPSVHIHKGSVGQLAAFPCGPSKFPILESKLDSFLGMTDEELKLEIQNKEFSDITDEIGSELRKENKKLNNPAIESSTGANFTSNR